ncbi:MAG: sodium/proton-translocating pyrophosphatase, partial [Thermomicrobiales bacterium]|nr:sodium/proton-translocating pyrophosphatase [Thermomicrobiales bacterium]
MTELNKGFYVSAALGVVGLAIASFWMLPYGKMEYLLCGIIGVLTAFVFVWVTQYYT